MELPIVQRLRKELQDLKYELAHQLPKALEEARAHGDLSENAEYEAARARQDFLRARIAQIEGRVREFSLYTLAAIPKGVVAYGSQVTVEDVDNANVERYKIVFPEEVDAANGCISLSSPLGRGLMNKAVGDEVEVRTPGGKRAYQIVGLVTIHDTQNAKDG
jgi:transcription elongation factor GreA